MIPIDSTDPADARSSTTPTEAPALRLGERRGGLWPLSVAPMMERTDRHFRWIARRLTKRTLLYTEMVTTGAVLHGDRDEILGWSPEDEAPVALQLGGDDPADLATCARIGVELGYDEINLNVGCPSDAVQRGRFGACLMGEPQRVADAVAAMRAAVAVPVTVKHRIGIDDRDRYEDLENFVRIVAAAGCDRFTVHARKAWLNGLSPKQNRTVPPLRYEDVHRLKREHPDLVIEINGGIRTLDATLEQLELVNGVMIGRAAYDDPMMLARADERIFLEENANAALTRRELLEQTLPYIETWHARGLPLRVIARHLHGLFSGVPGARAWKRALADRVLRRDATPEAFRTAIRSVPDTALDRR